MQIVILAGGLATRLKPLSDLIPKSMVMVKNKPFLQYQFEILKANDIYDIVLCVGHLSSMIKEYFGDGEKFGVKIKYSDEGENLLGTGGALKKAEPILTDKFFLMYGDSYLLFDYKPMKLFFEKFNKSSLLVVYKNHDLYDKSNVGIKDGLVTIYDKNNSDGKLVHIDAGLLILRKKALNQIPADSQFPLEELYQRLISQREMLAYEVNQRFYEIGSFSGLKEFQNLVKSAKHLSPCSN